MAGERLRIQVDDPYLLALGRALFVFSGLEWNAVWCCDRLVPAYVQTVDEKTAGQIAREFVDAAALMPEGALRDRVSLAAETYRRLVRTRNDIMHAQPCHAPTGEERLQRRGDLWTLKELEDAADAFAACSIELNDLFHHWME